MFIQGGVIKQSLHSTPFWINRGFFKQFLLDTFKYKSVNDSDTTMINYKVVVEYQFKHQDVQDKNKKNML